MGFRNERTKMQFLMEINIFRSERKIYIILLKPNCSSKMLEPSKDHAFDDFDDFGQKIIYILEF